jgi:hypothetical protein
MIKTQLSKSANVYLAVIGVDITLSPDRILKKSSEWKISNDLGFLLKENIKQEDLLGKYLTGEFVLLLSSPSNETACIILNEIRKLVEESEFEITVDGKIEKIKSTISIGFASCPVDANNMDDLLYKANTALYKAIRSGGNKVCAFQSDMMVTKSNYYSSNQLEQLSFLSRKIKKSESFLLREALDLLLNKYKEELKEEDVSISFEAGKDIIPLFDPGLGGKILKNVSHLTQKRKASGLFSHELKYSMKYSDNPDLDPDTYIIKIKGNEVAKRKIEVDKVFILDEQANIDKNCKISGKWVHPDEVEEIEKLNIELLEPSWYIAMHILEVIRTNIEVLEQD